MAATGETPPKSETPKDDALKAPEMVGQSWGDQYKGKLFSFGKNIGLNYAINTVLSAGIAYFFERNFGKKIEQIVEKRFGTGSQAGAALFAIRAFFLTSGGTLLLVPIKHLEENRDGYQYQLAQMLDNAQKTFGMSNADTERNLKEYKAVEDIALAIKKGEDPSVPLEEVKRLQEKYHLTFKENGDIEFDKTKQSWGKLAIARVMSILAAIGTNAALGATTGEKPSEEMKQAGNFGDKGFGKFLTVGTPKLQKALSYVPGFKKLGDQQLAANILLNDSVLTASSAAMFAAADPIIDAVCGTKSGDKLADAMDVNKDGWVSKQEAEAFMEKKFSKRDSNRDGRISRTEFQGGRDIRPTTGRFLDKKEHTSHAEKVAADRQNAMENPAEITH